MSLFRNPGRAGSLSRGHRRTGRRRRDLPALEWAEDMTGRCPRVTAFGDHCLLVENHTGILSFSDSRVLLDSRAGALCVTGSGLSLSGVRSGAMMIRGSLRRVELPCKGGGAPDEL